MESQLKRYGYQVEVAFTSQEALDYLESSTPDLIISELELGFGESAVELCQQLKSREETREVIFVMVTDHEARRIDCLSAGADDTLVKPIYMAELRGRIEQLLERRGVELKSQDGQRFFGRLEES